MTMIPRKTMIDGRWYSTEVAEMIEEVRFGRALQAERISADDQYFRSIVFEILDDMRHPLRQNERFMLAFARRLARVVHARTEKA